MNLLFNLVLVLVILFLLILLSWIWPPDSPWSPRWRTKRRTARAAFKLAKIDSKDTIYELGSGGATALIVAASEFGAKGVGIEIEPFRLLLSKLGIWRYGLSEKLTLIRGNFFEVDLSNATVVYVYLVPKTLDRLIPKFKKELKKGTPIISYKYKMNLPLKEFDKINELRIYVV